MGERVHHERERRRDERGRARRLQDPERDQDLGGGRQPARHRRHGEHGRAGEEDPSVTDAVGQLAGRDQQRGEHDRVRVQHPGELGRAGVGERGGDVGERDVEDRRVEERRQRGERRDRERAAGVVEHGGQLVAVSRVWNDSATSVPSAVAMRPCSTASPPALVSISNDPVSHSSSPSSDVGPVDVRRQVDADATGRRLEPHEGRRREPVRRHRQPGRVDAAGPRADGGSPGPSPGRRRRTGGSPGSRRPSTRSKCDTRPPSMRTQSSSGGRSSGDRRAPLDARPVGQQRQPARDEEPAVLDEVGHHRGHRASARAPRGPSASPGRPAPVRRKLVVTVRTERSGADDSGAPHGEGAHVAAVHPDQRRPPGVQVDRELARTARRIGVRCVVRSKSDAGTPA